MSLMEASLTCFIARRFRDALVFSLVRYLGHNILEIFHLLELKSQGSLDNKSSLTGFLVFPLSYSFSLVRRSGMFATLGRGRTTYLN